MNTISRTQYSRTTNGAPASSGQPSMGQPSRSQPYQPSEGLFAEGNAQYSLTMRDLLRESIGYYIISQHLVGVSDLVAKEGILTRVEGNCYVLHQPDNGSDIVCDYFSLKFFQRILPTQAGDYARAHDTVQPRQQSSRR